MIDLAGRDLAGLEGAVAELGDRAFRARQIYRWLYARKVADFALMTDLSQALRDKLGASARVGFPAVVDRLPAGDGTVRYAYALDDGLRTESVYIPGEDDRATLCLSSQVGCALACRFCLSGANGLKRDLSPGEIVGQAWTMLREAPPLVRVNIVFMGIGEPLDNFAAVSAAWRLLGDPRGFAIALKRMTVSTAGHVPSIERLGALEDRPRLAVSLNATTDETRSALMPINRAWPIARLLAAVRAFPLKRNERVTFEYVLLSGVNDSDEDARRLGPLLAGIPAKINLIPWNPSPGLPYAGPSEERVDRFAGLLWTQEATVTVRRRRGGDVAAACGQLSFLPRTADDVGPARAGATR